ncbi:glycosyltransferase [Streptomyces sp. NPDC020800]|uniref:glycosyltransferase n=1 Tax=Streptomyces sp. NPDC020800 TaxID=3365092 RepID=UPI00379CBF45
MGADATIFPCAGPEGLEDRPRTGRGVEALKYLWGEFFRPLAQAMALGVTTAVEKFAPDLLIVDQQALAGALVAERLGVPYATSATTSGEMSGSLDGLPKVNQWIRQLLDQTRQQLGNPSAQHDPRFSPWLTLVFSTSELAGQASWPGPMQFVGPALGERANIPDFAWDWVTQDDQRPLVLISLGTANPGVGAGFLNACLDAVRARSTRLRAVIADPGGVLGLPHAGADVLITPAVPQLALLAHTSMVVCHAGHNTVTEALWHGVPLIVAPIRDDQPVIASQVTAVGAGVRLRFGRARAPEVGMALDIVLNDDRYARAARRVSRSFHRAGGTKAAADHIEELILEEEHKP